MCRAWNSWFADHSEDKRLKRSSVRTMRMWKSRVMTFSCLVDASCSSRDGSNTYLMFGTHAAYGIVLEELAREQPVRETLEASYFAGPEHVEDQESSECFGLLKDEMSQVQHESDVEQTRRLCHKPGIAGTQTILRRSA